MVSSNQANEARNKILRAAEAEFAAKGFDGARVDAIAAAAGVNKALIYYYFKGKASILDTLLSEFFTSLRQIKDGVPKPTEDPPDWEAYWDNVVRTTFRFTRDRIDLVRITVQEELKGNPGNDRIIRGWKAEWNRMGGAPKDGDLFWFFYQDMPVVLFLLLNEKWSRVMDRDPAQSEQIFLELNRTICKQFYKTPPVV